MNDAHLLLRAVLELHFLRLGLDDSAIFKGHIANHVVAGRDCGGAMEVAILPLALDLIVWS